MLIFHDAQRLGRFSRLHPHRLSVFSSAPVFSLLVPVPGMLRGKVTTVGSGGIRDQGAGLRRKLFVMWSKVSQKEKNKHHILIHYIYIYIYIERERERERESRKMVLMKLFSGKEGRRRHREQTGEHSRGRERVGQIEKIALTYIHYHE